ncbi:hypothetical protein FHS89_000247 [Rubricella aquisinus]|uniref:Uncharacterized protein n=1 Tax=Rubricella aquisinus TaxID=2028108 RepID=A0A840WGI6_9RHOB|nr:hypothetical protein [Rubricella aquisinus]MBB5514249.1 hypothetical protein [Rubricella aquisinus]
MLKHALTIAALLICGAAVAGQPRVIDVTLTPTGSTWRAEVTVAHADTGWDHYADGWDIRLPDNTVLGHRVLHHPHVTEQPFTRSLSGITLPDDATTVLVRAHDSVHGWGPDFVVTLP